MTSASVPLSLDQAATVARFDADLTDVEPADLRAAFTTLARRATAAAAKIGG